MACSTCLTLDERLTYAGTWHDGTHIIPTFDSDDITASASVTTSSPSSSTTAQQGGGKGGNDDDDTGDNDDKGGDDDDSKGGKGKGGKRRRGLQGTKDAERFRRQDTNVNNPFFTPTLDSDDEGFFDKPVNVQFNFTGTS